MKKIIKIVKLCPFCGGEATIFHEQRVNRVCEPTKTKIWGVECRNEKCLCGPKIYPRHDYTKKERVIKVWNKRADCLNYKK